ncbi:MAG: hypothetical protein AAFY57_10570 [Cyanobacteria bacterium J06642_2]
MANYNRGIMKFPNADSPLAVAVATGVLFGVVGGLIWVALTSAYAI